MKTKVEIQNLTKYYGKTLGAKDITFNLNKGEIFGFIGPNGAGKSTTIRAIMNLINKTGTVLIDGKPFTQKDFLQNKKIGYLPGEIHLYEDLTVKEMLNYHQKFYPNSIQKKEELVKRFKLDETKKIEDLSLGNLKKLGIILTFMKDPEIFILDEPTNGLDPIMQEEFHKLILEEKAKGKTCLYSSHVLSEVSKICDRIAVIKDGKLKLINDTSKLEQQSQSIVSINTKEVEKIKQTIKMNILKEEKNFIKFKSLMTYNDLLKQLSKIKIDKIIIEEMTLEDIVMDYYK